MINTIKAAANDEIAFESLRPMEDAPRNQTDILAYSIEVRRFLVVFYTTDGECYINKRKAGLEYNEKALAGWIPFPTYKP